MSLAVPVTRQHGIHRRTEPFLGGCQEDGIKQWRKFPKPSVATAVMESRLLLALLSREILVFNYPKRGTKISKERGEESRCLCVWLVTAPGRHAAAR